MLRFLWIYPVAIIFAVSVSTYAPKHSPILASPAPGQPVLRNYAATPAAASFAPPVQRVESDLRGHYVASVQLEGRDLPMLIDTGASFLSLKSEDAELLGIRPSPSEFTLRMQTANGISSAAHIWLPRVRVGMVEVNDVEAVVMEKGSSATSLLGMSFLSRLSRFGVANGRLVLEQ